MKQVEQNVSTGETLLRSLPDPITQAGHVLVATRASVISAGTERYVVQLAKKSLIGKARARPDHVKRILQKMKQEGLVNTIQQVRAKMGEPMPLGYSCAGTVLECGGGVDEFKPGDRVAAAGPHAGIVVVPRHLCARIPDGVSFEQAAYTPIAAIGLEGVRLAKLALGEKVLVIGLGLIGQMVVCMLKAQGCAVLGTDLDPAKLDLAKALGADVVAQKIGADDIRCFAGPAGVDATIITASTDSNGPIELAAAACRPRGRIVLVGVAGLALPRQPFFEKELEFTVSSSLGPGRGDPMYEERGHDYPYGHVRWTAQRNMGAVLDLIAAEKLPVEKLTTHRYPIERAAEAYDAIVAGKERVFGAVIEYPEPVAPKRRIDLVARPATGMSGVSLIGGGNFARLIMAPLLKKIGGFEWRGICTAKGMTAQSVASQHGFAYATTDEDEVWSDPQTTAVFVATRHHLHAKQVLAGLRAGKHVFVEKPLCIDEAELESIRACVEELGESCPILMVGFNRRFSSSVQTLKGYFSGVRPVSISHRFAVPALPAGHWTQDPEVGGRRIVGEACHAVDTCVALAGSLPARIFAESAGRVGDAEVGDDRVFITIRHRNGAVSSVSYVAGGDRSFPAERIEIIGGGRTAVVEDWNDIQLWKDGRVRRASGSRDKGHQAEFAAFLRACKEGGPSPIPWSELYAVAEATILAARSVREGMPFECGDDAGPVI
jgi:predicted dehydrogenase/threonine dehydrogenase-like Zn-dependent dehydrogenase